MSGYDIKRFLQSLGWLLGNPSFGTIYPALHALHQDDLVTVEVVPHPSRPARKIYAITEAGRQALQEWTAQPLPSSTGIKAFIMHLILAGGSSRSGLAVYLRQRREVAAERHAALEQAVEALSEQGSLGEQAAIEYGLAIANAELAWLEGKLAQLSTDSETDPSRKTTLGGSNR
jgi:DNA-binding PadR family transcriptional regulator